MKETQMLKANHLSKNGVIIADDTDTVFPNVDKNNKTIRINLKNTKNQTRNNSSSDSANRIHLNPSPSISLTPTY